MVRSVILLPLQPILLDWLVPNLLYIDLQPSWPMMSCHWIKVLSDELESLILVQVFVILNWFMNKSGFLVKSLFLSEPEWRTLYTFKSGIWFACEYIKDTTPHTTLFNRHLALMLRVILSFMFHFVSLVSVLHIHCLLCFCIYGIMGILTRVMVPTIEIVSKTVFIITQII